MGRFAQTKNAAIGLDFTSMTAKRGRLNAQNAGVIGTSDKEMKKLQTAKNKFPSCSI
jgi:hypothetical protein